MSEKPDAEYSEEETERRMNEALKRALNTPPKPHKKGDRDKPGRKDDAKPSTSRNRSARR